MARKLVSTLEDLSLNESGRTAKIYRDAEWQEWQVSHIIGNGLANKDADYHTDSKVDAFLSATLWVWEGVITGEHFKALDTWKETHGNKWRARLRFAWILGEYASTSNANASLLHQLRNYCGPKWLEDVPN